jgi:uncharacterized protein (DUF2062 family)
VTQIQTPPQPQIPKHPHPWIYRRIALPILALLRRGATPSNLAWSLATGLLIGINPLLGSTTLLCLAAAFLFRLNIAASQLTNHLMYPLQLILVLPLIRLGSLAFRTEAMPLSPSQLLHDARTSPVALIRQLWLWEWHALVLWAALAAIAIPLIALALTPALERILNRLQHHQYPLVPGIE